MGDGKLVSTFAHLVDEPPGSYGVALLLGADGPGPEVGFDLSDLRSDDEDVFSVVLTP